MLASVPAGYIRYTLGVAASELTTGTELQILNDSLRELENCRGWKFLEGVSRPLSLKVGEPSVKLPTDFREIVALETNPSLLNNIVLSSWDEILQLRTNSIQSWGGYYRACVRSEFPVTKNLLGFTEDLSNAVWVAGAPITVTADQAISPAGESSGIADEVSSSTGGGNMYQEVPSSLLIDGQDYIYSIFLKRNTANASRISVQQIGDGGGQASTVAPRTVGDITWSSAGVPTISGTSEGGGIHTVRSQVIGDGWYRLSVAVTWDARESFPGQGLRVYLLPDTEGSSNSLYAWGAQLEEVEIHEDPYPTRYESNVSDYTANTQAPEWVLSIWPTPTSDSIGNFAIVYRRKLPTIASESDTIPIPDFLEPLYNELVRVFTRGYHEEDVMHLHSRLETLYASKLYEHAVRQDATAQNTFGPMRGLAATSGKSYRNWGSWVTIPTPS